MGDTRPTFISYRRNHFSDLRFIDEFKKHLCLWDSKHRLYRNKRARVRAFQAICTALDLPLTNDSFTWIKQRVNSMRTQFSRELVKEIRTRENGDVLPCQWRLFEPLQFLRPHTVLLRRLGGRHNLKPDNDQEEGQNSEISRQNSTSQLNDLVLECYRADTQDTLDTDASVPIMTLDSTNTNGTRSPPITTSPTHLTTSTLPELLVQLSESQRKIEESRGEEERIEERRREEKRREGWRRVERRIEEKRRKERRREEQEREERRRKEQEREEWQREELEIRLRREEHQQGVETKSRHYHFAMDLVMRMDEMPSQVALHARREIEEILFRYSAQVINGETADVNH